MELTGKCKEEFEKWQHDCNWFEDFNIYNENYRNIEIFYTLIQSMQYGVYVDFFDSVGIYINSGKNLSNSIGDKYNYIIQCNSKVTYEECFLDTNEARTVAIEKANKLHNEFLNK